MEAATRLEGTVIENKDAIRLIMDRDRPDGLIYCDPPYYDAEQYYDAAFSTEDHARLRDALKECKGYVIVSYNAGQMTLFESPLEFGGMRLIHIPEKPLKII